MTEQAADRSITKGVDTLFIGEEAKNKGKAEVGHSKVGEQCFTIDGKGDGIRKYRDGECGYKEWMRG